MRFLNFLTHNIIFRAVFEVNIMNCFIIPKKLVTLIVIKFYHQLPIRNKEFQ